MGQPMDYEPPMVAPERADDGVGRADSAHRPGARAWSSTRSARRSLRRPLDETVTTELMGDFEAGTQGALRFEVQGIVGGEPLIVIEHVTRIHPSLRPATGRCRPTAATARTR